MPRNSPEAIAKARAKNIGRKNTPETLAKMSIARKKYWEEHSDRKAEVGANISSETRARVNRERWERDRVQMTKYARLGSQMAHFFDEEWDRIYYSIPDVREWMSLHSWARGQNRECVRAKLIGREKSPEELQKLRDAHQKRLAAGIDTQHRHTSLVFSTKGGEIRTDSSYERRMVKIMDADPSVTSFTRGPRIYYMGPDGKRHAYFVDFRAMFSDGSSCLIEVKSEWALELPLTICKADAAKESENGNYIIVTERDLELMEERQ